MFSGEYLKRFKQNKTKKSKSVRKTDELQTDKKIPTRLNVLRKKHKVCD